jgi:hypothetical protein
MSRKLHAGALGVSAIVALGCGVNNPTYFPPEAPLEVGQQGAMGNSANSTVTLSFRRPTDDEAAALREESDRRKYKVPWLQSTDVAISVLYTITNLSDKRGTARVEINGASEFASYDPAALRMAAMAANAANPAAEEDENYMSLIQPTPVTVEPGKSISGIVREDDFEEAELDLDAIGRWMAVPASVLINRSEVNGIGLEMIPRPLIVPAMFRVQVIFTASTHMKLEFLVRVRDEARQLLTGMGDAYAPRPTAYMPAMAPAMGAMMMMGTPAMGM